MTTRKLDEQHAVVVIPSQVSAVTSQGTYKEFTLSLISEADFKKYADEAMAEYERGLIKPIQSSADLL